MMRLTEVVKHLLIINILLFIASQVAIAAYWFNPFDLFALHFPTASLFEPYQIVTHFFMHANLSHIFFNMFALVMFGSAMESVWGEKRFLKYYFICALGAAALHMGVNAVFEIGPLEQTLAAFNANPSVESIYAFYEQVPGVDMELNKAKFLEMSNYVELNNQDGIAAISAGMEDWVERIKTSLS